MIVYDAAQTRQLLKYQSIAGEIDRILELKKAGLAFAPERIVMGWNDTDCLLVMPAYDDTWLVNKLVTLHRLNPLYGLPMIQGEVVLFRRKDGARIIALDGSAVTAMRTAALSLVAIRRMGYEHTDTFTVCGSGVQAIAHIEAIFEWKPGCRIQLYARNETAARAIVNSMLDRGCQIAGTNDLANAVARSGVVVTATSSRAPFVEGAMVNAGRPTKILFVAVGAYRADMAELSPELVSLVEGPIGVDTVEGASREAGDLLGASISADRMVGIEWIEESQLLGKVHLFKSVGNALWDLAAARVAVSSQAFASNGEQPLSSDRPPVGQ